MFDRYIDGNDTQPDIPMLCTMLCSMFDKKYKQKVFWGDKSNCSIGFEHTLTASLSLMKTDRSCPFNSKNTSFSPFAVKSSAMASVLIPSVFPLSIVTFEKS
jgi:hypothetical protein